MIHDYDGAEVIDRDGRKVGSVERSYVDDRGDVRFVEVKIGSLRAKHRLIPVDGADETSGGLRVPYTEQVIEDSPDVASIGETLTGDALDRVRAYYAEDAARRSEADQAPAATPVEEDVTDGGESLGEKVRERLHGAGDTVSNLLHPGDHGDDTAQSSTGHSPE